MVTTQVIPDPSTPFGERVQRRLREELLVWLTTVGRDGAPQPNPVWLSGRAELSDGEPAPHELPSYLAKYGPSMTRVAGSPEAFSSAYPVALRIRPLRARGF